MWIFNLWRRPNVYVQPTLIDRVLEIVVVIMSVCLWGVAVYFWNVLPEEIPTHFDLQGNISGYGGKSALFVLAGTGTLAMIIMMVAAYNPKMINIPVKVSSPRQYFLMFRMTRVTNVVIAFLFMSILLNMALPDLGIHSALLAYSYMLFVVLILFVVFYYTFLIYKARD